MEAGIAAGGIVVDGWDFSKPVPSHHWKWKRKWIIFNQELIHYLKTRGMPCFYCWTFFDIRHHISEALPIKGMSVIGACEHLQRPGEADIHSLPTKARIVAGGVVVNEPRDETSVNLCNATKRGGRSNKQVIRETQKEDLHQSTSVLIKPRLLLLTVCQLHYPHRSSYWCRFQQVMMIIIIRSCRCRRIVHTLQMLQEAIIQRSNKNCALAPRMIIF